MKLGYDLLGAVVASGTVTAVDYSNIAGLVEKFGVILGLLIYFIVRDYFKTREDKKEKADLVKKVDDLTKQMLDKLTRVIEENTQSNNYLGTILASKECVGREIDAWRKAK